VARVAIAVLALALTGAAPPPAREILFVGRTSAGTALLVVRSDGTRQRTLFQDGSQGQLVNSAAWSPDGTRIVLARARGLFVLPAAGGALQRVTVSAEGYDEVLEWSRDGRWILFHRGGRSGSVAVGIYVVHPDGTGLRRLWRKEVFAAFAPDSRRIALATALGRVAVVDLTGRARRVADCGWEPRFSPDSRSIAFARCDGGRYRTGIAVLPARGGRARWLVRAGKRFTSWRPTWSPDGRTIAFERSQQIGYLDHSEIRMIGSDGRNQRSLDSHRGDHDERPRWSPDGRQLLFDRDAAIEPIGEGVQLVVADARTGRTRVISNVNYRYTHSWRPG
jgi:Tol biopolymer transport system component